MVEKFYTEVDLSKEKSDLKPLLIGNRAGHELLGAYKDLKPFFKGKLLLSKPEVFKTKDQLNKVSYLHSQIEEAAEVTLEEFNSGLREIVKEELNQIRASVTALPNNRDNKQKKLLINSFELPDSFENQGYKALRKITKTQQLVLVNWGFGVMPEQSINTKGIGPEEPIIQIPPDPPKNPGNSSESLRINDILVISDPGRKSLNFTAKTNRPEQDLNFKWNIAGNSWDRDNSSSLVKLSEQDLETMPDRFDIELEVEEKNNSEAADFFRKEAVSNPLKSLTSRQSWWEENQRLVWVALGVIALFLLLLFGVQQCSNNEAQIETNGAVHGPGLEQQDPRSTIGDTVVEGNGQAGSQNPIRNENNGQSDILNLGTNEENGQSGTQNRENGSSQNNRNDLNDNPAQNGQPISGSENEQSPENNPTQMIGMGTVSTSETRIGTIFEETTGDSLRRWIILNNGTRQELFNGLSKNAPTEVTIKLPNQ